MADPEPPQPQAVPGTVLLDVFILSQLANTLLRDAIERHGIPGGEFALSSAINAFGPITPTALAERLGIPPTTISSRLARLEGKRHVRRTRNPADGRSSLLETTDEGRRALEGVFPALQAAHQAIARHLDRPLEQMREDLAPLILALRAAVDDLTTSS
jgi:DNA-binding MarR family transcriptional regulator